MVPLVLQSSEARFFVELRVSVIDEVCGISTRTRARSLARMRTTHGRSADKLAKHHTSRGARARAHLLYCRRCSSRLESSRLPRGRTSR